MTLTIAVVGGGFGGTYAIKELDRLRSAMKLDIRVLLFEPRPHFVFTPLLHEVATAGLELEQVIIPFTKIYDGKPWIQCVQRPVTKVSMSNHTLLAGGKLYTYEYVLLATGSVTNYYGNKKIRKNTVTLKNEQDAEHIRLRLEQALLNAAKTRDPLKQRAALSIAVVGGGPTGVELSAEIKQFLAHRIKKYTMIDKRAPQVSLLQGAPVLLPFASPRLQEGVRKALRKKGVDVLLSAKVSSVTSSKIMYERGGERMILDSALTIWVAGVTPKLIHSFSEHYYFVKEDLSLMHDDDCFAIGDASCYDPSCLLAQTPALAQAAVQQGTHVARNIVRRINERATEPFLYRSKGFLLSVGQGFALGEIETPFGTLYFKGFFMWWLWRTIYLSKFHDAKQRVKNAASFTTKLFTKRSVIKKKIS